MTVSEKAGIALLVVGGLMIGPSLLLHRRAGHLVAPRPIVLVLISIGLLLAGVCCVLSGTTSA